jgi:hypothetical protein
MRVFAFSSLVSVLVLLVCPQMVSALDWNMAAGGCVPTRDSIQSDLYEIQSGNIQFRSGVTGTITLICPIDGDLDSGGEPTSLTMTFTDANGTTTTVNAKAQIRRMQKGSGGVGDVDDVLNSDAECPSGASCTMEGTEDVTAHDFDTANYFYYVQVTLFRSITTANVSFAGVSLT